MDVAGMEIGSGAERRRREARYPLRQAALVDLRIGSVRLASLIEDVSMGGMGLNAPDGLLPAPNVVITHPVLGTLAGRCAWQAGGRMGIALVAPQRELERVLQVLYLVM